MLIYVKATYEFDQELKRENVKISFHRYRIPQSHQVIFKHPSPRLNGLGMIVDEDGCYDLTETSYQESYDFDYFISWSEIYRIYSNSGVTC